MTDPGKKQEPAEAAPESLPPESIRGSEVAQTSSALITPRSRDSEPTAIDLTPPSARASRPEKAAGDPDTLISAPRPAENEEVVLGDRLDLLESQVEELSARLSLLEGRRTEAPAAQSPPWWIWLIFLVGLALASRLFAALK